MMKVLLVIFVSLFYVSCSSLRVGVELLFRELDGEGMIQNEPRVKAYLETILLTPEKYNITAYSRKVFSPDANKSPSFFHSFYVISSNEMPFFFTLSYSGTRKMPRSEGAWVINTNSDILSYISFWYGINEWDVKEIIVKNGINTEITILNVINRSNRQFKG